MAGLSALAKRMHAFGWPIETTSRRRVFIESTEQRCADGRTLDFVSLRQLVWNPPVQLSHHSHRMQVVSNSGSVTPKFSCQVCSGLMRVCLEDDFQRGVIDAGRATRTWLILKITISSSKLCKPFISSGCAWWGLRVHFLDPFVLCRIDIINSGECDHLASLSTNKKCPVSSRYIALWKILELLLELMHLKKFTACFS